ncbi:hypothetical protein [Morganella sp. EGD-HP17]|uniref:hypothetical protein n=1 Tax=Morganella sp. EGD-HP17 TaxID=1435146 RepID=UPI0004012537|nr:hypothetical protein [Morganella sp. EGD-HP17]ETO41156.1 hypothetical protein X965_13110 [Morganella sp. EGD-HP17]
MKKRIIAVTLASLFLGACGAVPQKKTAPAPVKKPPVTQTQQTRSATPAVTGNTAAQEYVGNKQMAAQGIVIASTRNACVDGFNFLKGLNQSQFDNYSADYSKINQNYTFLNINKEIMDSDSKELLTMTLNKKLDTLCAKVQYAGFTGVKERLKALSGI